MFICRNAEGVHAYVSKCWKGTLSYVGMLNGYTVKKRLGTPGVSQQMPSLTHSLIWCFVWRDAAEHSGRLFLSNIRWFMTQNARESGPDNATGALLKEQNHNFAERFNDSKWIAK